MAPRAYDKKCIALAQLETALRLFQEEEDLFSPITLAGASEEILGKLLEQQGIDHSLKSLTAAAQAIHQQLFGEEGDPKVFRRRANLARNSLKHLAVGGAPTVNLDLRQEAVDMLNRAIDNYWLLETSLTPAMERFQRSQYAA